MTLNVIIPAAGAGSRFSNQGWKRPKPFIRVGGKPLLDIVLENMQIPDAKKIIILQKQYSKHLHLIKEPYQDVVFIDGLTQGTACTVLEAEKYLNENELIVVNSDQYLKTNILTFLEDARARNLDGSILVFTENERNPKWSFAKITEDGLVSEVAEKKPISSLATVGLYYFKTGIEFKKYAERMIDANDTHNNEYYTCPVYNHMIKDSLRVGVFEIEYEQMHGLGTPNDLREYSKKFKLDMSLDAP